MLSYVHRRTVRSGLLAASSGAALAFAVAVPSLALAAEDPPAAVIEELVVTAEKRETNLQEVPVAISAFTGDRIEATGARSIVDIQFLAAGLNFGQDRTGLLRTSIRGINSNVGVESGVATHLDGVYLADRYDQVGAFLDVQRIEVLRGPQGTLYGRNATGGAINIITNDPTRESEAGVQATYGNYQLFETQGYASGPLLGDAVRGRIAFKTSSLPGYGKNWITGQAVNGADSISGRVKLDWDATEDVLVRFSADYTRLDSSYADEVSRLFPGQPLQPELRGQTVATEFDSNRNRPNDQEVQAYGAGLRVEWDLGFAKLTSLSAIRKVNKEGTVDIDASPEDAGYFDINHTRNRELTQELNLSSTDEGKLQWIVGGFILDNRLGGFNHVWLPLQNTPTVKPQIFSNLIAYKTHAYAIFGQATYAFSDAFDVTIGGRYSEEKNTDIERRQVLPAPPSALTQSNKSNSFTPRVTLQWKPVDDINLYATYAKGFKSGGFNPGNNDPSNFLPEKVTNYEVGLKSMLLDRKLLLNLAAFWMDYDDLQVRTSIVIPPGIPAVRVTNAAKARIKGVEADFRALLGDQFSIDGNFAYLDAKYRDFTTSSDPIGATRFPFDVTPGARIRDASGNQMVAAPKISLNVGAEYHFEVSDDWSATLRGEVSHQSRVYYTPYEDLRGVSQDPATVLNARVEFKNEAGDWSVAFWGRNLTDELIISSTAETNDGLFTGLFRGTTYRPPRTYGITVGKNF